MEVTTGKQTLILANERNPIRRDRVALDQILGLPNPKALQRITIVASRPDDSLVYMQAEYALDPPSGAASGVSADTLPSGLFKASLALPSAVSPGQSRGIALYVSTQALSNPTPLAMRLDVHA